MFDERFIEDANLKASKHAKISRKMFLPIDLMDHHLCCSLNSSDGLRDKSVWDKGLRRMSNDRHLLSLSIVMCLIFHLNEKRITLNWLVNYANFWTFLNYGRKGYIILSGLKANDRTSTRTKANISTTVYQRKRSQCCSFLLCWKPTVYTVSQCLEEKFKSLKSQTTSQLGKSINSVGK